MSAPRWKVVNDGEKANHVLPINDEAEHPAHWGCSCSPRLIQSNPWEIWTHRSLDCREVIEEAEYIKDNVTI